MRRSNIRNTPVEYVRRKCRRISIQAQREKGSRQREQGLMWYLATDQLVERKVDSQFLLEYWQQLCELNYSLGADLVVCQEQGFQLQVKVRQESECVLDIAHHLSYSCFNHQTVLHATNDNLAVGIYRDGMLLGDFEDVSNTLVCDEVTGQCDRFDRIVLSDQTGNGLDAWIADQVVGQLDVLEFVWCAKLLLAVHHSGHQSDTTGIADVVTTQR